MRSATARGGFVEGGSPVGGKRKAIDDKGGGVRETRRMRARRLEQSGEMGVQVPVTAIKNPIGMFSLQKRKKVDDSQELYSEELTTRWTIACGL